MALPRVYLESFKKLGKSITRSTSRTRKLPVGPKLKEFMLQSMSATDCMQTSYDPVPPYLEDHDTHGHGRKGLFSNVRVL